jgi:catechol 2,3-dioxygenase-like lactoylglutathione lyase family enzyme
MAKLRHVAIQCDDPSATAKFYCDVFGMKEMYRMGLENGAEGAIYLSDGTVNLALIRITRPDFPNYRPKGLNHIGFIVEDLDEAVALAAKHGAHTVRTGHEIKEGEFWEHKMVGPDEVGLDLYDVRGRGWPGISGLEDLGVKGEITPEAHGSGKALAESGS